MFSAQQSFLTHLRSGRLDFFTEVKSDSDIKEYTGQLDKEKIVQLLNNLPSVLLFCQPSKPLQVDPELNIDVIVVTKSDVFDSATNASTNMELSEKIYGYLYGAQDFKSADQKVMYRIKFKEIEIKFTAIDNKFAVVILGIPFTIIN